MAKMMGVKLNVSSITKAKLFEGKKGKYCSVTIALNDEPNSWGDNVSVWEEQTKEERDAKAPKVFIGTGKVFWDSKGGSVAQPQKSQEGGQSNIPLDENLPF